MATTVVQFRIEESLKNEAVELFDKLGLDLPTAFRMFLRRTITDQGIPFRVSAKRNDVDAKSLRAFSALRDYAQENLDEMSIEEIDEIIAETRKNK